MIDGFANSVAVVTGGSAGIGAAVTRHLIDKGAHVAVLDLDPSPRRDDRAFYVRADVTDTESVAQAIAEVAARSGRIDFLVNNAGVGSQGTVEDADDEEWRRVLEVNVLGAARVSRFVLPHLRRSPHPSIVNIGSVAAVTGIVNRAVYSASKAAVHGLTLAMAADHLADGIRVNTVSPGTTDTPWLERLLAVADDPGEEKAALRRRQPHGRLVTPDEVAATVVHLLDPHAGSTTATVAVVDGGLSALRILSSTPSTVVADNQGA